MPFSLNSNILSPAFRSSRKISRALSYTDTSKKIRDEDFKVLDCGYSWLKLWKCCKDACLFLSSTTTRETVLVTLLLVGLPLYISRLLVQGYIESSQLHAKFDKYNMFENGSNKNYIHDEVKAEYTWKVLATTRFSTFHHHISCRKSWH
jgi:hypothetical protein